MLAAKSEYSPISACPWFKDFSFKLGPRGFERAGTITFFPFSDSKLVLILSVHSPSKDSITVPIVATTLILFSADINADNALTRTKTRKLQHRPKVLQPAWKYDKMQFATLLTALTLGSTVTAHMKLQWPYPFRDQANPNVQQAKIDYSMTSPLNSDGSNFPCKGYQVDMDDSNGAGKSIVTWDAGAAYNFSVTGGATHGGGSCQIALSYDKGKSFTVIHSYIGSCPLSSGEQFQFTIPGDAPTGSSMFAWVWYNEIGNREIYMNCASVTIGSGSGSAPATKFSDRPDLFVANLGNGCTTVEGKEVQFPDPGPAEDVTIKNSVADDSGSYTGTCAAVNGIGGSGPAPSRESTGEPTTPATTAAAAPSTTSATEPTTLSTSTRTTTVTVQAVAPGVFATATASGTVPAATGTGPADPVATGTSGAGSAMVAGSPCSTGGMWNCVDGTSFQQCASGQWSVVQLLAAGTQCTPGQSSTINIFAVGSRRRLGRRILRRAPSDFRA